MAEQIITRRTPCRGSKTHKYCPKCGAVKLRTEFHCRVKDGKRYFRGYCQDCTLKPLDLSDPGDYSPDLPSNAYFAGHFDGEGCVMMNYVRKNTRPVLRLSVSGAHLPTLKLYQRRFGGSISKKPHPTHVKPQWQWHVSTVRVCLYFLRAIQPYAIEKREQINAALGFLNLRVTLSASSHSAELNVLSRDVHLRLKALKQVVFTEHSPY